MGPIKARERYWEIYGEVNKLAARRCQANGHIDTGDFYAGAMKGLMLGLGWTVGDMPAHWTLDLMTSDRWPFEGEYTALTGVQMSSEAEWKFAYRSLEQANFALQSRINDLAEALSEALDFLDGILEEDAPESVAAWRKTLNGEESADAEAS